PGTRRRPSRGWWSNGRSTSRARAARSSARRAWTTGGRDRGDRRSPHGRRISRVRWSPSTAWKSCTPRRRPGSPTSTRSRCPTGGAATACYPIASSSGRVAGTASTTGWSASVGTTTGSPDASTPDPRSRRGSGGSPGGRFETRRGSTVRCGTAHSWREVAAGTNRRIGNRVTAGSNGSDRNATLSYPGGELVLDVVDATLGSDAVQLGPLLAETGMTTLDVGFVNTSACTSSINYIDGGQGVLRHRGYPIDVLAEKSSFLEVAYLLINGEDPTETQLTAFTEKVLGETSLPGQMMPLLESFPLDTHPMPVFSAGVSLFGTHGDDLD